MHKQNLKEKIPSELNKNGQNWGTHVLRRSGIEPSELLPVCGWLGCINLTTSTHVLVAKNICCHTAVSIQSNCRKVLQHASQFSNLQLTNLHYSRTHRADSLLSKVLTREAN